MLAASISSSTEPASRASMAEYMMRAGIRSINQPQATLPAADTTQLAVTTDAALVSEKSLVPQVGGDVDV